MTLLLLTAVAVFLSRVFRNAGRSPVFEMAFEAGRLRSVAGPIPERIRRELLDVAAFGGVSGTLRYFAPGDYAFSNEVGEGDAQRFRNVLQLTFSLPPTPC